MIDITDPSFKSELIISILSGNFTKTIMDFDLSGIKSEDIRIIFSEDNFRKLLIELIVEFSFIEDYKMKKTLNERMFSKMIDNLEGLFKNDYITKRDYVLIMNEINKEIDEI